MQETGQCWVVCALGVEERTASSLSMILPSEIVGFESLRAWHKSCLDG